MCILYSNRDWASIQLSTSTCLVRTLCVQHITVVCHESPGTVLSLLVARLLSTWVAPSKAKKTQNQTIPVFPITRLTLIFHTDPNVFTMLANKKV